MTRRAAVHFETELRLLVDRFRREYHLTYVEAVGVLQLRIARLAHEAIESDDEPEDTSETEP